MRSKATLKRNHNHTILAHKWLQIGTHITPTKNLKRMVLKKIILIVVALLAIYGIYRTTAAVIDHIRYIRSLEDSKSQLESENNTLSTALQLSEKSRSAMMAENERIKTLEKESQRKTAELNTSLIKQREESQNEITRLETALRNAGVNDVRVPDDVIRMQRERAKEINQRASENYRRSHQQTAGKSD